MLECDFCFQIDYIAHLFSYITFLSIITSKMITLVDEVDPLYFLTESPSTLNPKF